MKGRTKDITDLKFITQNIKSNTPKLNTNTKGIKVLNTNTIPQNNIKPIITKQPEEKFFNSMNQLNNKKRTNNHLRKKFSLNNKTKLSNFWTSKSKKVTAII
jgi:hypothetical protein